MGGGKTPLLLIWLNDVKKMSFVDKKRGYIAKKVVYLSRNIDQ